MARMGKALRLAVAAALVALALAGVAEAGGAGGGLAAAGGAAKGRTRARARAEGRDEQGSASSAATEEDPDKESEDGDQDDEDGNPVDRSSKGGSDAGVDGVEAKLEKKELDQAAASQADCSVVRTNSTCGKSTDLCSSVGKCQEGSFKCEGKFKTVFSACICPESRRGDQCQHDAITIKDYDCQLNNACGGRGECVKFMTRRTDAGTTIHYGCACAEGYAGPGCHLRTGVAIAETTRGELIKAVPNNGGYFAFLELFRARLAGPRN